MKKAGIFISLWLAIVTTGALAVENQGSAVLLQTGSVVITNDDMTRYIADRIAAGSNPEIFASRRGLLETLEALMVVRQLGQDARDSGVTMDEQLQWRLELERDRILHRAHLQKVTQERIQSADWEAAAREIYTVETDRYKTSPRVRASHVLISTQERDEDEARALAEQVLARAQAGENFEQLVAEYSDDPSAENNQGDMGFFGRGQMVRPFEQAAFALEEDGQLSDLVQTRFGFHIIKLHERQPAGRLAFDEVKDELIKELQTTMAKDIRERMLMEARSPAGMQLNEAELEELEQRFSSPQQ